MTSAYNVNGKIIAPGELVFSPDVRHYRYGDGFFESMKFSNGLLMHSVLHWERIAKSAMLLKLELPMGFDRDEMIRRIETTATSAGILNGRVRCSFLRDSPGLYSPISNTGSIIIEIQKIDSAGYDYNDQGLTLGSYREMTKNGNYISMLKTTSALIYVMASIYAREQGTDECLIYNDQDRVAEAISSNVFIVSGEFIVTPPVSEYCVDGVMRKVVMNQAAAYGYTVLEQPLSEVSITSADEVFLTSATRGIRWVGEYKGKMYKNTVSKILADRLNPVAG